MDTATDQEATVDIWDEKHDVVLRQIWLQSLSDTWRTLLEQYGAIFLCCSPWPHYTWFLTWIRRCHHLDELSGVVVSTLHPTGRRSRVKLQGGEGPFCVALVCFVYLWFISCQTLDHERWCRLSSVTKKQSSVNTFHNKSEKSFEQLPILVFNGGVGHSEHPLPLSRCFRVTENMVFGDGLTAFHWESSDGDSEGTEGRRTSFLCVQGSLMGNQSELLSAGLCWLLTVYLMLSCEQ